MTRPEGGSSSEVRRYVDAAPVEARAHLRAVRAAIRQTVPTAIERMSYGMPAYGLPGPDPTRVFAWFGLRRRYVGLYLRLPTIADHRRELAGFATTKSAVHLPLDRPIPSRLVARLVRTSLRATQRRIR